MRPVSDRFLASVRGSHRAVSQALALDNGQNGVEPGNTTELSIISGDVRFDSKAQIRSALTLEVEGSGLWPRRSSDRLAPFGTEIYVRRGLDYGGGTIEYVGLGYFRIDSIEQDQAPDGPIRIMGSDRMAGIIDARLTSPEQFGPTWTYGEILDYLIAGANGFAVQFDWDDDLDEQELGRSALAEEDRWQFIDDLLTAAGKIWYWDHRGYLVVKDPPSATEPVWECNSGAEGVLVEMGRDLSREGVYNGVVATGEAFDMETAPARALAVDDNFLSPTYWYGDFGKVPRFYASPFITTDAQALSAATSLLRQNLGLPYSADFTNVPNPALEPWDPIRITLENREELHIVETLVVPLSPEQAQTGTTREQTGILIGEA